MASNALKGKSRMSTRKECGYTVRRTQRADSGHGESETYNAKVSYAFTNLLQPAIIILPQFGKGFSNSRDVLP